MRTSWSNTRIYLLLILAMLGETAHALEDVRVSVINGLTQAPVANLSVVLKRRTIGTTDLSWAASRTTDAAGSALFQIDTSNNSEYQVETKPYNNWVRSSIFQRGNSVKLKVGTLPVQVVDGNGKILTNYQVVLQRQETNGQMTWINSAVSSGTGAVVFDPPNLDSGVVYRLSANSPWDASVKFSGTIDRAQSFRFVVGNRPLIVKVTDGISNQPMPNQLVQAYEQLTDGSLQWRHKMTTDSTGVIRFDLDGLGQGRQYQLNSVAFNQLISRSATLTQVGNYTFALGKLKVQVRNGDTNAPLTNFAIDVKERQTDGKLKWVSGGTTDTQGVIRFDLPGITNGTPQYLVAASPIDGTTKISAPVTKNGAMTFSVGNHPLNVRLEDGITHGPLANRTITAEEILSDGTRSWTSNHVTDAQGGTKFDLDGLGSGRQYQLSVAAYNGTPLRSAVLTTTTNVLMQAGTLLVTLQNGDIKNQPMAGKKLILSQWTSDGHLTYIGEATTDSLGQAHFNTAGLDSAGKYVVNAVDPYGESKVYYSPLNPSAGLLNFRITQTGDYALDVKPPTISIAAPLNGGLANVDGFLVQGSVKDDHQIDKILVRVSDPTLGENTGQATLLGNGLWQYRVPAGLLHSDQPVTLRATAIDLGKNQGIASIQLRGIEDVAPPSLSITSQSNNEEVLPQGFLLSGTLSDDVGIVDLQATIVDPLKGSVQRDLSGSLVNGHWDMIVYSSQISAEQTVKLTVSATDTRQHVTTKNLQVRVTEKAQRPRQLINRLTFGATPTLQDEIHSLGPDAYIQQQLHPENIDDDEFQASVADFVPTNADQLILYNLKHATQSRRQLQEVLTWFWENHFNTDIRSHGEISYEFSENQAFRKRALGSFRELLSVSAHSPAMMRYLNNAQSYRSNPNENYAREIMELHTLGVTGGYTQADVVAIARAFTGWTNKGNAFYFDASRHDTGEKVVLGHVIPAGGGQQDGETILDILASHPSTAKFICKKLSRLLVTDNPGQSLIDRCADVFLQSSGNIPTVVQMLVMSPEFSNTNNFRAKVRTPLEFTAATLRLLELPATSTTVYDMNRMGIPMYRYPVPTGYSETGDDYLNSDQWQKRVRFVNQLVSKSDFDIALYFDRYGYNTKQGVVGFLQNIALDHQASWIETNEAFGELGTDFSINQADAAARLRAMTGLVLSFPAYSLQ